ncbi:MAG: DUF6713 family protein [Henriciella sp.]|uniref:DUF6713 family protein n=1 Tax=Henriciella sp. TaxID=1968823 RepID=UPI003C76F4E9
MREVRTFLLILMVALLCTHELDAMTHAEWRMLPILSGMEDGVARQVFVWFHIPLFALIFWAVFVARWRELGALVFALGAVIHSIAHFLLSGHHDYSFVPPVETVTVYGAGLFGAVYLTLRVWSRR